MTLIFAYNGSVITTILSVSLDTLTSRLGPLLPSARTLAFALTSAPAHAVKITSNRPAQRRGSRQNDLPAPGRDRGHPARSAPTNQRSADRASAPGRTTQQDRAVDRFEHQARYRPDPYISYDTYHTELLCLLSDMDIIYLNSKAKVGQSQGF